MQGQIFIALNSDLDSKELYFELVNALMGLKNKEALKSFNIIEFYERKQK